MSPPEQPPLVHPAESALETLEAIEAGYFSPRDVVESAIARIEATDPFVNAMPVRCFERALAAADAMAERQAAGEPWPPLAGLTVAVKDNADVAGVPTSGGSPITAGQLPAVSHPAVARLEANGAIVIGKSNLSELGGANTTNRLFGATRNPYDTSLTAGGSSGGSAAALATGQVLLAHGNDVGGSLRTPAAFCGVTGLRPTPGIVARKPLSDPFDTIFVEGPMARSVADLALMLDAMAGPAAADLLSRPAAHSCLDAALSPAPPRLAAVSPDLGSLPVDRAIRIGFDALTARLARAGLEAETASPDVSGAQPVIDILRGLSYAASWGALWPARRADFTAEVGGDITRGLALTGAGIGAAMAARAALYREVLAFFARYDVLICPVTQVPPFPVEIPWPTEIDGVTCPTYVHWIAITYVWSVVGCPALAVSLGRDAAGLPLAVQVVGPPHSEHRLLAVGAWLESAVG